MEMRQTVLFAALVAILLLLWQAWEQQSAPMAPPGVSAEGATLAPVAAPSAGASGSEAGVPSAPSSPTAAVTEAGASAGGTPPMAAASALTKGERIEVVTDLYRVTIDTAGGDLRELALNAYPVSAADSAPFAIFNDGTELFVAQSGLIGKTPGLPTHETRYTASASSWRMAADQDSLSVPLQATGPDGARYTKTYVFTRGSYHVGVEFQVENATSAPVEAWIYAQFQRIYHAKTGIFEMMPTFTGGAWYTLSTQFQKIDFKDFHEAPLGGNGTDVADGWVAMLQHYFVAAWLPPAGQHQHFYTRTLDGGRSTIGYRSASPTKIAPGESATLKTSLFVGPKDQKLLKTLPAGMDLTVDYGMLTFIAAPLFWVLSWIHRVIGNWGWAIIFLTILIKGAFWPLSAASYRSMAKMKAVGPRMQALKERHGDDRQKLNQEMMELYKKEKINPLGGCLPIFVQIPVFIALYWVLLESVELRQAPWMLWIRDLSVNDPLFVLPLLMGVTMFLQQHLNPQPMDPVQKKVFMVMPVMFTVLFLFMPAGLVLYWTINNILSIAQQWHVQKLTVATAK